jgi:hypothetical protein
MNVIVTPSGKLIESTAVYNNFKYRIEETSKTTRLIEVFLGDEVIVGEVRSWKRELIRIIEKWFSEKDERERGYRLFLALKVLNNLTQPNKTNQYLQVMRELSLEESIFWVWQYHSYYNKAIHAFKYIHLNSK